MTHQNVFCENGLMSLMTSCNSQHCVAHPNIRLRNNWKHLRGCEVVAKAANKKRVQLHKHSDILRLHSKSLNYTWSPNIKLCLVVQAAVYTGPWGYIQNVYVKSYSFKNLYIISLLFTRRHFPIERSKYLNRSKIHQECILSVCLQTKHTFLKHIYTLWTDKETRDKKRVSML